MNLQSVRIFGLLGGCAFLLAVFVTAELAAAAGVLVAALGLLVSFSVLDRLLRPTQYAFSSLEIAWLLFVAALMFSTIAANLYIPFLDFALQTRLFLMLVLWSVWIFVIPTLARDAHGLAGAIRAFDAFGLAVSASVFLPMVAGIGEAQTGSLSRTFGPFGDPVPFVVALFACRAFVAGRWPLLAFHLAAVLVTLGLGATLTLSVSFAAHFILPWRARTKSGKSFFRRALLAIMFLPVVIGVAAFLAPRYIGRVADPVMMAATVASRVGSFEIARQIITEHPVAGVGMNGFNAVAHDLGAEGFFIGAFSENFISNAQNQFLQTLTDTGAVGFAMFAVFCLLLYRRLSWAANECQVDRSAFRAYQIWFVGLLVGNQTAVWLLPFSLVSMSLFVVVGLALAAARLARTGSPLPP